MKVLIVFAIILVICIDHHVSMPVASSSKDKPNVLMDLIKNHLHENGAIIVNVNKYAFHENRKLITYGKKLLKEGFLKGWTESRLDQIISDGKDHGILTFYSIGIRVAGPTLLTPSEQWSLQDKASSRRVPLKQGDHKTVESRQVVLKSGKLGVSIEFILGPSKSNERERVSLAHFDKSNKDGQKLGGFLIDPTLDISMKSSNDVIRYTIILHSMEPQLDDKDVRELVRALSIYIVQLEIKGKHEDLTHDLDIDITQGVAGISLKDDNINRFIQRWAKGVGNKEAVIDLYSAVKKFVANPNTWTSYPNAPHNYHEIEVDDAGDLLLSADKFNNKDLSLFTYGTNFKPVNKADKNFEAVVDKSLGKLKTIAQSHVGEDQAHKIDAELLKMLKQDSKTHQKNAQVKYRLEPMDKHFSFRKYSRVPNANRVIEDECEEPEVIEEECEEPEVIEEECEEPEVIEEECEEPEVIEDECEEPEVIEDECEEPEPEVIEDECEEPTTKKPTCEDFESNELLRFRMNRESRDLEDVVKGAEGTGFVRIKSEKSHIENSTTIQKMPELIKLKEMNLHLKTSMNGPDSSYRNLASIIFKTTKRLDIRADTVKVV